MEEQPDSTLSITMDVDRKLFVCITTYYITREESILKIVVLIFEIFPIVKIEVQPNPPSLAREFERSENEGARGRGGKVQSAIQKNKKGRPLSPKD